MARMPKSLQLGTQMAANPEPVPSREEELPIAIVCLL